MHGARRPLPAGIRESEEAIRKTPSGKGLARSRLFGDGADTTGADEALPVLTIMPRQQNRLPELLPFDGDVRPVLRTLKGV